jgi:hypothetical protein
MKILNLDKLSIKEERELVIGGQAYPIEEMTVSNFVETTRAAERIAAAGVSIAEQIDATIEMIVRSIPTLQKEVLQGLTLEKLQVITAFVRGDDVDGVEQAGEAPTTDAGVSAEGK